MMDIFLEAFNEGREQVRICDHGMTLMRLSYNFDLDTENKKQIFRKIISENSINEEKGNLYLDVSPESLYPAILQFAEVIAKVSIMQLYKREIIHSMFYEFLAEFIEQSFRKYNPRSSTFPILNRDGLEVDYQFDIHLRPIFFSG